MQRTRGRALLGCTAAIVLSSGLLAGCAVFRGSGSAPNWREQGLASWYGADFHGRRTANGERYNMYAMTAAHKTLPLGTRITVTHRETGRRIRVRVNDRGPFVAGRVVDLSLAAALALGSAGAGVAPVTIEAALPDSAFAVAGSPVPAGVAPATVAEAPAAPSVHTPVTPPPLRGSFAVQVGSFALEANARALAPRLPVPPETVRVLKFEDNRGTWWRVWVGGYADETEAVTAAAALAESGLPSLVVRED